MSSIVYILFKKLTIPRDVKILFSSSFIVLLSHLGL